MVRSRVTKTLNKDKIMVTVTMVHRGWQDQGHRQHHVSGQEHALAKAAEAMPMLWGVQVKVDKMSKMRQCHKAQQGTSRKQLGSAHIIGCSEAVQECVEVWRWLPHCS